MNEEGRHFSVGETEGAQHDHPVDAVRRDEDVLADDMQGGPSGFEEAQISPRLRVVAGEADVVGECVEPDIGHKGWIERKLNAPGEARFWAGNAKVACELFHGVSKFGNTEIWHDKRGSGLRARVDEVEEPVAVFGEFEVVVLLLDLDDFTPLRPEFAVGSAFFFGEELLLAHAVVAALSGFVELALIPESLEHTLHTSFVEILNGSGPSIVAEIEFLPKLHEEGGDLCDELRRLDASLLCGLLHLLAMLIHTSEEEYVAPSESLVTGNGIGKDLLVGVAYMRCAVGVVDRSGDEKCVRHAMSGIGFDFSTPRKDARLTAGGLGFLDLVVADMEEREARPSKHVLRSQLHGLQSSFDGLDVAAVFHQ